MSDTATTSDIYSIPEELKDFRDTIRQIAQERIAPRAAEIDAQSASTRADVRELLAEHDILALPFEEEYGGTGTGTLMLQMGVEEIAKACASSALILMVQELGSLPIRLFGSDELKQRVLPRCATGEWSPAFALSEPEAGSDPAAMRTHAELDGDEWVINGAQELDQQRRRRRLLRRLRRHRPREATDHRLHRRGRPRPASRSASSSTSSASAARRPARPSSTDVRVPAENVIGEVGRGLAVALGTLERTRLGAAAQAVGIAQGATDYATAYANERVAFGKPIIELQAIQFKLAEMETGTAAARELLYKACAMADRDEPGLGQAHLDGEAVRLRHRDAR